MDEEKTLDFNPDERLNVSDMNEITRIAPNLQLFSLEEVCRRLQIGHWMVYKLIGDNRLPTVTIGKRRFVTVMALKTFIERLEGSNA